MKDFTDRVNAVLPSRRPMPFFLLSSRVTLDGLRGSCPAGQSLAKDDRCLPTALLSVKPKKTEMTEVAPPSSPTPAAAPVRRCRSAARRSTAGSGFSVFWGGSEHKGA